MLIELNYSVKIWFTIEKPPEDGKHWPYDIGRITEEMMRKHLAYPPTYGNSVRDTRAMLITVTERRSSRCSAVRPL